MEEINYYTFEDRYSQQEISRVEGNKFYKAFGIVLSINTELISLNKEGIMVCYRSPNAVLKREYRSIHQIELKKVDFDTWSALRDLIQGSKTENSQKIKEFAFNSEGNLLQLYHQS